MMAQAAIANQRPAPSQRTFTSEAVESALKQVRARIKDATLGSIFENCFPSTLDTTVTHFVDGEAPDTFVITGDIEAMWLRDSTNQILPYVGYAPADARLARMIAGVVGRHARSVAVDPYANAFNRNASGAGWHTDVRTPPMQADVFEGKYELDSLANALHLAHAYWRATNDTTPFNKQWQDAADKIVSTMREQQAGTLEALGKEPYKFQRSAVNPTETTQNGIGMPTRRCGLVKSAFRPSDDATTYSFLIPANAYAVVALRELEQIWSVALSNPSKAADVRKLADEIDAAIWKYGVIHADGGDVFAYEVDGFGNQLFMDDANVPSLLSLPYLGYVSLEHPVYQRTRAALLNDSKNPWFFKGTAGAGIGGPHIGVGYVWPMAVIMRALTSTDDAEISQCLKTLTAASLTGSKTTPGQGYGFMHESFWMNDASQFTRPWFAWANALFGELIVKLSTERPYLL